jgi:hypothetical protein
MIDFPTGWSQVVSRSVMTAVVAFVVLQAKEFYDTGLFDTPGTGADAVLIGVGMFAVSAGLKWASPRGSPRRDAA